MLTRLQTYASFVRLSHSLFALPFALTGALLASRLVPVSWTLITVPAPLAPVSSSSLAFLRLLLKIAMTVTVTR